MGIKKNGIFCRSPAMLVTLQSLLSAFVITLIFAGSALGQGIAAMLKQREESVIYTLGSYIIALYDDHNYAAKISIGSILVLISLLLIFLGQRVLKISLVITSMLGCILLSLHITNAINTSDAKDLSFIEQVRNSVNIHLGKEDPNFYNSTVIALCVGAILGLVLGLATCSILKVGVALIGIFAGYLAGGIFIGYFNPYLSLGWRIGIYAVLMVAFVALACFLSPIMAIFFTALTGAFMFTFGLQLLTNDYSFILNLIDGAIVTGRDLVQKGSSPIAIYAVYIFLGAAALGIVVQTAHYMSRKKKGVGYGNSSKHAL